MVALFEKSPSYLWFFFVNLNLISLSITTYYHHEHHEHDYHHQQILNVCDDCDLHVAVFFFCKIISH